MDQQKIAKAVKDLLIAIGEDPKREGLAETPQRVAKMYQEVFSSLNHQPEEVANYKVFHVDDVPEMVLVQHIPFYSMCEHHLLPFFGYANVAYVPKDKKVIGLSKIPRLLDFVTKKPGMQERVTTDLVAELQRILDPAGIAVTIAARHLCMEMRGVNKAGQFTYTDKFTGQFKTDRDLKQEFLNQTRNYRADL
ncbi:GTP cyclohydrolase I FolE [Limosilactobacillus reuteri]|uniref:GTP cyclohydrolase 1 n=1 Tax=Limosilactobacillus reuteri TaxID=1598 RepID=A0AB36AAR5_LIMRT|nr:GTP cyclohydrolase I FolE [Limosilactobacillus reuteri]MBU5283065.1 GTP cyclohydrolase I FolE [Limosilactobacillus reuteri]MCC4394960.1 GTP cyclohydrolase I FolE [Limosilactobacillus reuteri]MCC4401895.1 GTP cyclohydrolase I FolE [Limosilactobacillus reuteri]MCH5357712.1 GTP cyclohydrolase I FolE [Limosilactobacillus reuteri]MRG83098.1 GTP cyclohydrolase I FolE [Limosilactobacillus reuteri]